MAEKVKIKFASVSAALKMAGTTYKGSADAAKEPTSNQIDEHIAEKNAQRAKELGVCKVVYTITKTKIIHDGPYAMTKERFKEAIQNVCDSIKKGDFSQIGEQAIGMFSWFQIFNAKKCEYYVKAKKGDPTIKVTVRDGHDDAEFETAKKSESLKEPGMRYVISQMDSDPTRPNSPLSPKKFSTFLGSRFRDYLKDGVLKIEIRCKGKTYDVEPSQIDLPPITGDYPPIYVKTDPSRIIRLELYFDPTGKSSVSIRRRKIPNVDDLKELGDSGLGLEKSILASGFIAGNIDADFLEAISGKKGIKEDNNWLEFLVEMNKLLPGIEETIQRLKQAESKKKLKQVYQEASQLAREVLSGDYFAGLALLEGVRKSPEPRPLEGGFDFVPDTLRVDPGKEGGVSFKTYVSKEISFVPDGGTVLFRVDNHDVEISPKSAKLREANADEEGIVTVRIRLYCKKATKVTLTATYGQLEAQAKINFSRKKERPWMEKSLGGTAFNFQEVSFDDDPMRHSRLIGGKTLQINTINPDYLDAVSGSHKVMRDYVTLLIVKETLVQNKPETDNHLEMFLTAHFIAENKSTKLLRKKKI